MIRRTNRGWSLPGGRWPGAVTVLVLLLLASGCGWAADSDADTDADADGMRLEIRLDPERARLDGRMSLVPARLDGVSVERLRLDAAMAVDAVTLDGADLGHRLTRDGWLELERDLSGEDGRLVIEYGARLGAPRDARPGAGHLGPEAGFLPAGADWYPRLPEAEPHPLRIELDLRGGHVGVASGSLVSEQHGDGRYRATFHHPAARAPAVATGPWEIADREVEGITVRTLFPSRLEAAFGETYREKAAGYIERYAEEIGPYPFESFIMAATPRPVGLAFSGFTLLGEQVVPLPFIPRTSLGHEVLHMWWGTGVYVDRANGNWSEGLTTFMADYQFRRERDEAREIRGRWLRDYAALPAELDRPHRSFRGGNAGAARIVGYHRGAMLWLMLEDRIGREAFVEGARALYREQLFRQADWDAVIEAFDGAVDEDLRPFFRQWTERAGAPRLELRDPQAEEQGGDWRLTGVLVQADTGAPRALRVPLVVETAAGRETHWVEVDAIESGVRLKLDARPQRVAVDPDWRVFRQLAARESPRILRAAVLDPETRVLALDGASPAELAPWLGRAPQTADEADGPRILLGEAAEVAQWLRERDLPGYPGEVLPELDIEATAVAWAVPGTALTVISGVDPQARRALAAELRHRAHYSYAIRADDRLAATGLWPQPGVWQELEP